MSYLPDVNVWLAAMWGRHMHHAEARRWIDQVEEPIALCRVTQMAVLRLISNPRALGKDAVSRAEAWRAVDDIEADSRVVWSHEPPGTGAVWRAMSARRDGSHKLWTDDYLSAFAQSGKFTLVTLDRALGDRHPSVETLVLSTS